MTTSSSTPSVTPRFAPTKLRIAEIYCSRQGEGLLTGTSSWFIRTAGCNLRCWFCDTPFASWDPAGEIMSLDEIVQRMHHSRARHVVLTGGEPMLPSPIVELSEVLNTLEYHITIETAGTLYRSVKCDLMSISPKFASSTPSAKRAGQWHARHEKERHQPEVIRQLTANYNYQIKFVIDGIEDCRAVESYLIEFPELSNDRILLMPQGVTIEELTKKQEWLEPYCQSNGFIFCARKHIEWYGNQRGT